MQAAWRLTETVPSLNNKLFSQELPHNHKAHDLMVHRLHICKLSKVRNLLEVQLNFMQTILKSLVNKTKTKIRIKTVFPVNRRCNLLHIEARRYGPQRKCYLSTCLGDEIVEA